MVLKPDSTRLHTPLAAALGDIGSSGPSESGSIGSISLSESGSIGSISLSESGSIGFYPAGSPLDRRAHADSDFDAPRRSRDISTAASPKQLTLACDNRRDLSIRLKPPAPATKPSTTSARHVDESVGENGAATKPSTTSAGLSTAPTMGTRGPAHVLLTRSPLDTSCQPLPRWEREGRASHRPTRHPQRAAACPDLSGHCCAGSIVVLPRPSTAVGHLTHRVRAHRGPQRTLWPTGLTRLFGTPTQ